MIGVGSLVIAFVFAATGAAGLGAFALFWLAASIGALMLCGMVALAMALAWAWHKVIAE